MVTEALVESDGETISVRHVGEGPLIVLCHGFPETGVCWIDQLEPLAEAGFTAAAIDLRGMGRSSVPINSEAYSMLEVVDDVVRVAAHLGHDRFHVVGNDIGAMLAWHTALLRPEHVLTVTGLSLPHFARGGLPPLQLLAMLTTLEETPYLLRFIEADAHLEMERDPESWVEGCIASISGLVPETQRLSGMVPLRGPVADRFLPGLEPSFLPDQRRRELVDDYRRTGFAGALQWYHRIDADWPALEPWGSTKIAAPCQFIGGEADPVRLIADGAVNELPYVTASPPVITWLPGVGHWPHLEAPNAVRELIVSLARGSS